MTTTDEPLHADSLASYRPHQPLIPATPASVVDMFVAGAVLGRVVYAVTGADGIASVASQTVEGAQTYLFWSHAGEAEKWADALVSDPRVVAIDLVGFLSATLPAMSAAGAIAALDWSAEPIEVEMAPEVLAVHLTEELTRDFAAKVTLKREVWMVEDEDGLAKVATIDGREVVPLWADRQMGEYVLAECGRPGVHVSRVPLLQLTNRYLLSPAGLKAQLAPAYLHVARPTILSPWALKALLNGASRAPSARIAQLR